MDDRHRVLDLRIRLERVAARAFDAVCAPESPGRQTDIAVRLTFTVAFVPDEDRLRVRRQARLGAHVYSATSDVLHGRHRAPTLNSALLSEWRAVVEALESVVSDDTTP
jgi:hypothetical protein